MLTHHRSCCRSAPVFETPPPRPGRVALLCTCAVPFALQVLLQLPLTSRRQRHDDGPTLLCCLCPRLSCSLQPLRLAVCRTRWQVQREVASYKKRCRCCCCCCCCVSCYAPAPFLLQKLAGVSPLPLPAAKLAGQSPAPLLPAAVARRPALQSY
jgi:hypothetical protein